MNAIRRREIANAIEMIANARAILESARDDEQESFDNMIESMQEADKGTAAMDAIAKLEEAMESAETIENDLQEIVDAGPVRSATPRAKKTAAPTIDPAASVMAARIAAILKSTS